MNRVTLLINNAYIDYTFTKGLWDVCPKQTFAQNHCPFFAKKIYGSLIRIFSVSTEHGAFAAFRDYLYNVEDIPF